MRFSTSLRFACVAAACLGVLPTSALARDGEGPSYRRSDGNSSTICGPGERPLPTGSVTVVNPAPVSLKVKLGASYSATLPAGAEITFGAVPAGDYLLEASYTLSGKTLTLPQEAVDLDPHEQARVRLSSLGAGLLRVENGWVEPVRASVDGGDRGLLGASQTQLLGPLGPGRHTLTLTGPNGAVYMQKEFVQDAFQVESQTLKAEATTTLTFNNQTGRSLRLSYEGGRSIGTASPGAQAVRGVESGKQELVARLNDGREVGRIALVVNPFTGTHWTVSAPQTAEVKVMNPFTFPVQVYSEGKLLGHVGARESRSFVLPVGEVRLVADQAGRGGARFATRVEVDPWEGAVLRLDQRMVEYRRDGFRRGPG